MLSSGANCKSKLHRYISIKKSKTNQAKLSFENIQLPIIITTVKPQTKQIILMKHYFVLTDVIAN